MRAYVDTSVLVRVLLRRPDRLRGWRRITTPMSSELTRVEAMRVIDRARIAELLDAAEVVRRRADVLELLARLALVGLSRRILERAAAEMPTPLGTLDAIHLATALSLKRRFADLGLATHDEEMRAAGEQLGLRIVT